METKKAWWVIGITLGAILAIAWLGNGVIWLAGILVVYFLPTMVAAERKVPSIGSVAVINLFLGWTLVGWVVALAMAARSVPTAQPAVQALPPVEPPDGSQSLTR